MSNDPLLWGMSYNKFNVNEMKCALCGNYKGGLHNTVLIARNNCVIHPEFICVACVENTPSITEEQNLLGKCSTCGTSEGNNKAVEISDDVDDDYYYNEIENVGSERRGEFSSDGSSFYPESNEYTISLIENYCLVDGTINDYYNIIDSLFVEIYNCF